MEENNLKDTTIAPEPAVNDLVPPPQDTTADDASEANTDNDVQTQPTQADSESENVTVRVEPNGVETVTDATSSVSSPVEEEVKTEETVSDMPSTPASTFEPEAKNTPTMPQMDMSSEPSVVSPISNNSQTHHEHRNNKKFIAIVTIVIALLLAGAAVYVYISAQENASETAIQETSQDDTASVETTPATLSDVDQTTQELDTAIDALDDTSDFREDSLSDTTLGL